MARTGSLNAAPFLSKAEKSLARHRGRSESYHDPACNRFSPSYVSASESSCCPEQHSAARGPVVRPPRCHRPRRGAGGAGWGRVSCKYTLCGSTGGACQRDPHCPARVQNGATALIASAAGGHVEVTRLLLEKGADIHAAMQVRG